MPRKDEKMTPEHKAAISESMKLAFQEGRHKGRQPSTKVPHGTIAGYRGARARPPCHCTRCRKAWREYKRERRKARD
jgi:hypothetical protein